MAGKRKKKGARKHAKQVRSFVEAGGQKYVDFFRHLASSQQWREHGTLPPLSNDEALILNHMYQMWLSQSDEEKEEFLSRNERSWENDGKHFDNVSLRDTFEQSSTPPYSPLLQPNTTYNSEGDLLSSQTLQNFSDGGDDDASQAISVGLCLSTVKNNVAKHTQYSDSLLNLVNQLDILVKAPEPTRTHAHDLVVMFLSPAFINRDVAALEQRIDSVSSQLQVNHEQRSSFSHDEMRDHKVHLAVASACCILLAVLAESEHLITERYQASLPKPFQQMIARQASSDTRINEAGDLKSLFDDIATSYYLRSLTIAFPTQNECLDGMDEAVGMDIGNVSSKSKYDSFSDFTSTNGCGGRNSIAAMQLGCKYLRGGVENGALLSSFAGKTAENSSEYNNTLHRCEQEYRQAFQWFLQAALLENPIAQHKVGFFYDEGLPFGACEVHIMEAVKWYSRAAELMPDSMHNLAKIYEDGRGGFEADLKQAVNLYSVAAARGFPLSQVNLGRLFLLGEDGVQRDREAGKRLLTLAAESGDADAQMVVGMIHATPAFECYDLALSEHWLCSSLAGGKQDAERLLGRVRQHLLQQQKEEKTKQKSGGLEPLGSGTEHNGGVVIPEEKEYRKKFASGSELEDTTHFQPLSQKQLAVAAKERGEDFLSHDLLHAAVLEFSRAFELDRTCLGYFVDRMETLFLLGHYEECLSDSALLLDCVDTHGEKLGYHALTQRHSHRGHGDGGVLFEGEKSETENTIAMKRLYRVLSQCLSSMHSGHAAGSKRFEETSNSNITGVPETFLFALPNFHRDAVVRWLLIDCMELSGTVGQRGVNCVNQQTKLPEIIGGVEAAQASAFLAHLSGIDFQCNKSVVRGGGVPIFLAVMETVGDDIWKSSSPMPISCDRDAVQKSAHVRGNSYPRYAFVREQLWLNCLVVFQHLLNPPTDEYLHQQCSNNSNSNSDAVSTENRSNLHQATTKKLLQRRNLVQLIAASDGFSTFANCATVCLQKVIITSSSRCKEVRHFNSLGGSSSDDIRGDCLKTDFNDEIGISLNNLDDGNNHQSLHKYRCRECVVLTRTTTIILQILHGASTVADGEHMWLELLRGGIVQTISESVVASVLTMHLQLEILLFSEEHDAESDQLNCGSDTNIANRDDDEEEAPVPQPVMVKESSLNANGTILNSIVYANDNESVVSRVNDNDGGGEFSFHVLVGQSCTALRQLSHTLQAIRHLLQVAPLEVLLRLSASVMMTALYHVLGMLCSPISSSVEETLMHESSSSLLESVRRNLLATKEPSSSPLNSHLSLSLAPSSLLDQFSALCGAQMLAALTLPLQVSNIASVYNVDFETSADVRVLMSRLAQNFEIYELFADGSWNSKSNRDSGIHDSILPNLKLMINAMKEIKVSAASCLCALLCARDPRNVEALRKSFSMENVDNFLWQVNRRHDRHDNIS